MCFARNPVKRTLRRCICRVRFSGPVMVGSRRWVRERKKARGIATGLQSGWVMRLLHGNLPRLGLFTLVQRDGENAVGELGVALALIHRRRQGEATLEA